jgi:hypothetical protein
MELLVLLELMSPERYAAELAAKDAAAAAAGEDAAAGDAPAAAAGEACGVLPAVLDGLAGACSTEPGASTLGAETNSGAATAAAAEVRTGGCCLFALGS